METGTRKKSSWCNGRFEDFLEDAKTKEKIAAATNGQKNMQEMEGRLKEVRKQQSCNGINSRYFEESHSLL